MPLNKSRLGKIEHQLHELTGQEEDAAVLAQRQQWHYEELCYRLGCEPAEIDFQEYVKIWWESTTLTWWVLQAAPDWALCAWVQQHCQCLYPVLTRFLDSIGFCIFCV